MKTVPKPRLFDKRIQLVTFQYITNEFGGATTNPLPGQYKWAYVRRVDDVSRAQFVEQFGLTNNETVLRMTIRETTVDFRDLGVLYAGDIYRVLVALPNDQYNVSMDLIAVKYDIPTN